MSKKRWQAADPSDGPGAASDRARAAARAMAQADAAFRDTQKLTRTHLDRAMRHTEAAMAAAGVGGSAGHVQADAAMRAVERLECEALERSQTEVDQAMRRTRWHEQRAED